MGSAMRLFSFERLSLPFLRSHRQAGLCERTDQNICRGQLARLELAKYYLVIQVYLKCSTDEIGVENLRENEIENHADLHGIGLNRPEDLWQGTAVIATKPYESH
jgi:hypothetical protein